MPAMARNSSRKALDPSRTPLIVTVVLALLAPAGAEAQLVRRVPDDLSCPRCSIELREVATLGDRLGPGVIWNLPTNVMQDGRGRYWVFDQKELPLVFDGTGRFVAKVGRKGPGPRDLGEYRGAIALPGDSVLYFDDRNRAVVIGPDLAIARALAGRQLLRPSLVIQWPDSLLLHGPVSTPGSRGHPLHLVGFGPEAPRILRSFGGTTGEPDPRATPFESFQVAAPATGDELWAAPMLEYRVRRMTRAGSPGLEIRRAPAWFAERSSPWLGNRTTPPPPRLFGVREAPDGLLWVFIQVAAPGWRDGWARVPAGMSDIPLRLIDVEKFFDLVVEVIEPAAGRVVARRRFEATAVGLPAAGPNIALYRTDDAGDVTIRVVALSVTGRR